jgi:hypothetical protein
MHPGQNVFETGNVEKLFYKIDCSCFQGARGLTHKI